jgi:hypothetical protein
VAVVVRALHHLDLHPADHHQVVLAVQVRPVVARRVDRQIDAMALAPTHVVDLHLPVQVLLVHPVRIAMAHHLAVAPQVVVTHPIAALTQVDHQLHAAIHRVQVRAHLPIAGSVVTVHAIHVRHQIVPIVHPVLTVTDQSVVMIVVRRVIVQQVAHMETETHVQVPVRHQIAVSAVTVQEIHDHLQIVHPVHTVTDQNVAMIVVRRMIVQLVVHTVTEIRVQVPVRHPIAQQVVHTETETHVRLHAQVQIVHVAKIHTVAIVHAPAMTATHVRLRVTANAEAVQIVPEVVSPMIAKSVHAVALAKSA